MDTGLKIVNYYGISQKFKTIEYGPTSLEAAFGIVEERFDKMKSRYDSAEEAIAETMFGFSRDKNYFIEICLHTPEQISFKFEHAYKRSIFGFKFPTLFQKNIVLKSKAQLLEEIRFFFAMPADEYQQHFTRLP